MNEGIIKDAYEAIIKEIQTILTLSYVIAVAIGMLFSYQKYAQFNINIFDYSDVFDFLIAPFSDFKILLFSIGSISIIFLFLLIDIFWKRKYPKSYSKASFGLDKKKWYDTFRYLTFTFGFVLYLFTAADIYGNYVRKEILNKESISIRFADNEIKTGKLIGKTKDTIFLLNGKKVKAIPITSLVKEIEVK